MQRVESLAALAIDTSALVHEVQRERGASSGFLSSKGTELAAELTAQRSRTDARLAAFNARLEHIRTGAAGTALADKIAAARDAFAGLADMRRQVSDLTVTPETSFTWFTAANTRLLDMLGQAATDVEAPDVARSLAVYLSLLHAKELAGQERAVGAAGFAAGRFDVARLRHLTTLADQPDLYFRIIAETAAPARAAFMRQTLTGEAVDTVARMRRTAVEGGIDGHLDGITGGAWFNAATARIDRLKLVEDRMAADLQAQAAGIRGRAETWLYATAAALLALTAVVSTAMIRAIMRPLDSHIGTMQRLAVGETDVVVAGTERPDEPGSMARAIAVFRDHAIENQRFAAEQQVERARAEAVRTETMAVMAERIEAEAREAMVECSRQTAALAAVADAMQNSAGRTGASADSAAGAAAQVLGNTPVVASAAEELTASIQEIGSQMQQSTQTVTHAVQASQATREAIEALNERVGSIGQVADMISEIASRTNLLALNATIEAARAGEAGKGFAVVASEVKQLAAQTARSTEEITRHIAEVRAATGASVAAVGQIDAAIGEVNGIVGSIAAAIEEQSAATAEIARNVIDTAAAATLMSDRTHEVSAEAAATGEAATRVRDNTLALNETMKSLQRALVRMVRTSSKDVDRRRHRRRPSHAEATMTHGGQAAPAIVHNVSERGCFVVTTADCQAGESVEIALARFARRLHGHVLARSDVGLHISFPDTDIPAAEVDAISLATVAALLKQTTAEYRALADGASAALADGASAALASGGARPDALADRWTFAFDGWYDTVTDPETLALPSFRAIGPLRRALYDSRDALLMAISAGDRLSAQRSLDELRQHDESLLRGLEAFGRVYAATVAQPGAAAA
ncbi:methyl-accepting chemotaxis protein [Rhodopila globiformis]|uniref:Methyl-accepting chemotaxis protein n=1 Tax=Rhodopila globiformis TaxID=1071 RepID=A0A2S6NJN0_RHOGL|nr:nitrate- and nitrite sensing domain-containing protein [Rhodopila globiformis]PPQ35047.1 hypothetical protein CCS01_09115 [Rhodopila globiformis]